MPVPPDTIANKEILKRLGILKNQLLIFVVLICLILNGSAYGLDGSTDRLQKSGGLVMHFSSVLFALLGIGFYIYAFFNLPSSAQELVFVNDAQAISTEHKERLRKPIKRSTNG